MWGTPGRERPSLKQLADHIQEFHQLAQPRRPGRACPQVAHDRHSQGVMPHPLRASAIQGLQRLTAPSASPTSVQARATSNSSQVRHDGGVSPLNRMPRARASAWACSWASSSVASARSRAIWCSDRPPAAASSARSALVICPFSAASRADSAAASSVVMLWLAARASSFCRLTRRFTESSRATASLREGSTLLTCRWLAGCSGLASTSGESATPTASTSRNFVLAAASGVTVWNSSGSMARAAPLHLLEVGRAGHPR
jgi:hypothetical protein